MLPEGPKSLVGEYGSVRWEESCEGPEGAGRHRGWARDHRARGTRPVALSHVGGSPTTGAAEETWGEKKRAQQNLPGEGKQARRWWRIFVKELEGEIKGRMVTLGIKETKGEEVGGRELAPSVPAPPSGC